MNKLNKRQRHALITFLWFTALWVGILCALSYAMSPAFLGGGILSQTRTQQARIIADGGTVINLALMDAAIRHAISNGYYSSLKFLGAAEFAVKKDGANAVSTLYDISGNNNDMVQATGSLQPIWTANQQNGRAGISFDGSNNYMLSTNAVASNTIQAVLIGVKPVAQSKNYPWIVTQIDNDYGVTDPWGIGVALGTFRISYGTGVANRNQAGSALSAGTPYLLGYVNAGSGYLYENGTAYGPQDDAHATVTRKIGLGTTMDGSTYHYKGVVLGYLILSDSSFYISAQTFQNQQWAIY